MEVLLAWKMGKLFLSMAAVKKGRKWLVIVVGISFMALLRGLYDVFSDSIIGIIIAAFGYIVFITYLMHTNKKG